MLHKTRGVVFKYFKYRDTSIIVKIYTEEFGLQTYIVNGVRSSKGKISLYQPLTLLDLVVYKKPQAEINRISQTTCSEPLKSIPYDILKSSVGVFLAEVLYKVVKEEEQAPLLFRFIHDGILTFDEATKDFENFHLVFLIQLSHYLGFGISGQEQFPHIAEAIKSAKIDELVKCDLHTPIKLSGSLRREILDDLITFYKTQVDGLSEIKSVGILKAVLAG